MADKFWKAVERRIAKLFGTERIGAKNGNCQPDFVNDWLVGEVVCHDLPQWVWTEYSQATLRAHELRDKTRLPILVIHEKNGLVEDDVVMLRLNDFVEWFGSIEKK